MDDSAGQHAYVFIHELVREALEAAAEVAKPGAGVKEAGPALRRLRSWGFLQSLLVSCCGKQRKVYTPDATFHLSIVYHCFEEKLVAGHVHLPNGCAVDVESRRRGSTLDVTTYCS